MIELNTSLVQLDKAKKTIRISGLVEESIVDGPGIRLVVFTQGCRHNCLGCHNPLTHNSNGGYDINLDDIVDMVKSNPLLDGVTFSGGDPFEQATILSILAKKIKAMGLNIVTYTGFTFEEIISKMKFNKGFKELLLETDILIDGRFEINKKNLTLAFRGSDNQRIIDVKQSIINKTIELIDQLEIVK